METAVAAPLLIMLFLGAAQVGQIAYTGISVDTAAREGALAGAASPGPTAESWPTATYFYTGSLPAGPYTCTSADFTGSPDNPVCAAVYNSSGRLDPTAFTDGQATVTITILGGPNLQAHRSASAVHLLATSSGITCSSGNQATVSGLVDMSAAPAGSTATLTDSYGDSLSNVTGSYTMCVSTKISTETITAQVGQVSCGAGWSGSVGPFAVTHGQPYPDEDIAVSAEPTCPPPTPPPSGTPTPTPTPTPVPPGPPPLSPGPTLSCGTDIGSQLAAAGDYISVTVRYPAPVFVPVIGSLFATGPGVRQVSATITVAIEPCTMTGSAT